MSLLLSIRVLEQLEQLLHQRQVPLLRRFVGLLEHPLPRHVLRRGLSHHAHSHIPPRTLLIHKGRPALEPLRPPVRPSPDPGCMALNRDDRLEQGLVAGAAGHLQARRELAPGDRPVRAAVRHEPQQVALQPRGLRAPGLQPELLPPDLRLSLLGRLHVHGLHPVPRLVLVLAQYRRKSLRERAHVHQAGLRLVHKGEVRPAPDPGPKTRVELLDEAERAVVHRPAGDEAVVRVEVPLAKSHPQPLSRHARDPLCCQPQQSPRLLGGGLLGVVLASELTAQSVSQQLLQ
mmetsp:Transcript_97519/g.271311  ORF Transcript_97519/g.271311 Transcript_97519/m.271311 type:complete len:289 (-) Transcript_97519:355-1221(-)